MFMLEELFEIPILVTRADVQPRENLTSFFSDYISGSPFLAAFMLSDSRSPSYFFELVN